MILVVEDDAPSSRAIALALKTAGHEVMNAGDGTEALELLAKHDVELVITDVVMPNQNGMDLKITIRSKWPQMPVILMSGHLWQKTGKTTLDGRTVICQKPFTPTALLMTVERLLPKSN
jgi:two-component system response regulator FlrC